jgi:hypothetical protein
MPMTVITDDKVNVTNSQYCLVLIFDSLLKKGLKSH